MAAKKGTQVTAVLAPELIAWLDAYAAEHRWSRSAAMAAIIEDARDRDAQADAKPAARRRAAAK